VTLRSKNQDIREMTLVCGVPDEKYLGSPTTATNFAAHEIYIR